VIKKKQISPEIQIREKLDQFPLTIWQDIQEHFLQRTMRLETFLGHRKEQEKTQAFQRVLQDNSPVVYTPLTSRVQSWHSGSAPSSSPPVNSSQVSFRCQMLASSLKMPKLTLPPMSMLRLLEESFADALAASTVQSHWQNMQEQLYGKPKPESFLNAPSVGRKRTFPDLNAPLQPGKFLMTQMLFDELKSLSEDQCYPEAIVVPSSSISLEDLERLRQMMQEIIGQPNWKTPILPTGAKIEYLKPQPLIPASGIQIIAMPEMLPGEALLVGKSQLAKLRNIETSEAAMRACLAVESKRFERQAREWEDIDLRIMQAAHETEAERKKRIKRNRIKRAKWRLT
jgi:hypothetical protein